MANPAQNPTVGTMRVHSEAIGNQYKSDAKKQKLCLTITVLVVGLLAGAGVGAGTYLAVTGPALATGFAYAGVSAILGIAILTLFAIKTRSNIKGLRSVTVEAQRCFQLLNESEMGRDEIVTKMTRWEPAYFQEFVQAAQTAAAAPAEGEEAGRRVEVRTEILQAMVHTAEKLDAAEALTLVNQSALTADQIRAEMEGWEPAYFQEFVQAVQTAAAAPAEEEEEGGGRRVEVRQEVCQALAGFAHDVERFTDRQAYALLNQSPLSKDEIVEVIGRFEVESFQIFVQRAHTAFATFDVTDGVPPIRDEICEAIILNHRKWVTLWLQTAGLMAPFVQRLLSGREALIGDGEGQVPQEVIDSIIMTVFDPNIDKPELLAAVTRRLEASTPHTRATDFPIFLRHWRSVAAHFADPEKAELLSELLAAFLTYLEAELSEHFLPQLQHLATPGWFQNIISSLLNQEGLSQEIVEVILRFPDVIASVTGVENGLSIEQATALYKEMAVELQKRFLSALPSDNVYPEFVVGLIVELNGLFAANASDRIAKFTESSAAMEVFSSPERFRELLNGSTDLNHDFVFQLLKSPQDVSMHVEVMREMKKEAFYESVLRQLRESVNDEDATNPPDWMINLCRAYIPPAGVPTWAALRYKADPIVDHEDKFRRISKMKIEQRS